MTNFKQKYQHQWGVALKRQNYSITWLKDNLPEDIAAIVSASTIGKGANSIEWIEDNGEEKNAPDYVLKNKESKNHLIHVEVTHFRHDKPDCWVRDGKIEYAQNNPDLDYWVIAVDERLIPYQLKFIKPDVSKDYKFVWTHANMLAAKFYDSDPEMYSAKVFLEYLETKTRLDT